ncbi:hypothetical protein [Dokdonella ginsengisoli]|uniref:Sel1 repeat family protein n=1 Tax=Dokdonella ginsengisoli TaxID=363846 RepID=A0ABV9QQD2_9GAMM
MTPTNRWLALMLLAGCTSTALAAQTGLREDNPQIFESEGFLNGHQDMAWRNSGMFEYKRQRYADAARYFRDAAYFGDKPSQAMLAMMLWNGDGIDADRAQAYAWIDLAAERGYESFVATREKFWAAMNEDERSKALEFGRGLYEKYGDEHANKRLEFEMERSKRQITGSRLGRPGTLVVNVRGPDGRRLRSVDGSLFYSAKYWKPENYRAWQDQRWDLPEGKVEVGPVQPAAEPE